MRKCHAHDMPGYRGMRIRSHDDRYFLNCITYEAANEQRKLWRFIFFCYSFRYELDRCMQGTFRTTGGHAKAWGGLDYDKLARNWKKTLWKLATAVDCRKV